MTTAVQVAAAAGQSTTRRKLPLEASILLVMVGIALIFELLGWTLRGQSFLFNSSRLLIIILQVSTTGLLAIGVTQVIITTGIDLSSGSVVALAAMVAASLAQPGDYARAVFPALTDLPALVPIFAGLVVGALAGLTNGSIIAYVGLPPFIVTLGMMVTARGLARYYTHGQPIGMLTNQFTFIGSGAVPVIIFLITAAIFHVVMTYTKYGKYTYAIGGNMQAARVSGINVKRHLVIVYTIAGLLSGLGGIITAARSASGQAGMGMGYELDAIAASVIGGTNLFGGIGRITGTVIGTLILGLMISGFTFLGVNAYIQDIAKGVVIIAAVTIDQIRRNRQSRA
jgi:inositol transport system permease protein